MDPVTINMTNMEFEAKYALVTFRVQGGGFDTTPIYASKYLCPPVLRSKELPIAP